MRHQVTFAPLLMALFCIVVWGLSYPVTRSAVQQIPPLTLASIRFFIAAALLWPLTRSHGVKLLPGDGKWLAGLTLTGITLYFGFENSGLELTSASHGALIIATIPLGTELVESWQKRALPGSMVWLGTGLALGGVTLLVGQEDGIATLQGDLLMFGAVASWIAYTFLLGQISGRYPNLLLTRWMMFWGGVSLLPGVVWEYWSRGFAMPGPAAFGGVIFLALVCSAAGYDLWNRAVPALGPTRTNTLLYLLPIVGVLGGVVGLDEPVTSSLVLGSGLILCGVLLAQSAQKRKTRDACLPDESGPAV